MRLLITLVLLCAVLWSGYWFISSRAVEQGFNSWLEDRRNEGWVAETTDLAVQGFPNRIDTSFTDLALADPNTGLAWEAPLFQILALSYRPNHVIAVWPPKQRVATPYEKFDVTSTDMRASLVVEPNTALSLTRATLTAADLSIANATQVLGREADSTDVTALTLAAERVEGDPAPTYRLGLKADGFSPSLPWRMQIDPAGGLPDTLDALQADVSVTFDAPWDRFAIERARPQPRWIKVKLAQAKWGKLELQLAGELAVDESGQPDGELTVKARNWREILDLGIKSGVVPEILAGTLSEGLGLLSQLSGNPNTLDVPLDFNGGQVFLGPIPLGPAPVLSLR